ncbi:MAG: helix-turn-helix domain-containing protein, partial [Bacteroidaceae bacterium]|nr:helix-turn-helix domain-containing protein [Bacteroidaceae bacterium]
TQMTINEIASELGFTYPTHFARMFRQKTNMSPLEFRRQ